MGLGLGAITNFLVETDVAAGRAKLNKSLTKARDARNKASATEANLLRWSQSLQNSKLMEKAGDNYGTITENIGRAQDNQTLSKVQQQLAASERLGAATAAFASAGLGGASAEVYSRTLQTQQGLQTELTDRNIRSQNYLMEQQRGSVIGDAVDSMSRNVISANFDFTDFGPTKGPSLLGNVATLAVAAGLSAAGAPQLGNAVLKARTGQMKAQYGDGTGASKSFGSALEDLKGGVNELKDTFRFNSGNGGSMAAPNPTVVGSGYSFDPTLSSYLIR